ncbi:purine-nucleoside phosphorylase [Natranaerovirga pectinivora]|uniref:Purine nucleoside phosphorylase n=1 Tax=Natranaerovirga pectinivora TaxID=682400 RepID=A0A4R3MEK8_9FIRM|nr:purine-nucleoside phosphorylase [Natranaerovirga pectinivora]TCT12231.1 purine-nucleoside phosphorylase [Natranaerovirga pectinivora]
MIDKYIKTKEYIESQIKNETPTIGLILGSGLGTLTEEIINPIYMEYKDIPNFPISTVEGHKGRLVIGQLEGKMVIAMDGRFHYYEGYELEEVTFPIRVMKLIGVEKLIITNAAGGLRKDLTAGKLMLIKDHINMTGNNPLIGKNIDEFGPRFPDMSSAYDKELIELANKVAKALGIELKEGIYTGIAGPYYYSKAELRMLIKIGGDAIGMSTVPETIIANHTGIRVLGISCITDSANPDIMHSPNHDEIVKVAEKTKPIFIKLVKEIINKM